MADYGAHFASTYWHRHTSIRFTQEAMGDPARQLEEQKVRAHQIITHWDRIGIPVSDEERGAADHTSPVVSGYGVATISMIYGCKGVFTEEMDPYAEALDLSDEAIGHLTPITLDELKANPVIQDLEEQAAWLVKEHGKARIGINMQSVPNIAFKLRGDQLMFDFYDNPELVHKLVDYVQQSWITIRTYLSEVNAGNGCPDGEGQMVTLDNCNVALVSPEIYREFFLPYDIKSAAHYSDVYGVHHCGANMHLFAEDYAKLGAGIWFDIGYGSDVPASMAVLKTSEKKPRWSVRYGPVKLKDATPDDIREERDALANAGADIVLCIGVDPDTPDENLKALMVP
ncbi:MAG: uroporphyrinogen decarboxylase family protein [Planctomycetota bacterium]